MLRRWMISLHSQQYAFMAMCLVPTSRSLTFEGKEKAVADKKAAREAREKEEGPAINCLRMLGYFQNTPREKCRLTTKVIMTCISMNCAPDVAAAMKKKKRQSALEFLTRLVLKHGATGLKGPAANACAAAVGVQCHN
eukprot:m.330939 g.330939  ORF g.330939 m.330939 type:complete len:138 (+) comp16051_c0_seq1:1948-2361(+)